MADFKLGIIGGGITGNYAAYLASQKNIKVEVFERTRKKNWLADPLPTRKCGEGIWKKKIENAGIEVSLDSPPEFLENSTENLLLGRLRQTKLEYFKGKIDPYLFINRQILEKNFYAEAVKNSAIWHFGENVNNFQNWRKKNNFDLILGSWGTNLNLTSQVTKREYQQGFVLACQYTMTGVNSVKIENAKTLILADDPTIRYFYIFPKGEEKSVEANVGVVFNTLKVKLPFLKLNQLLKLNPWGAFTRAKVSPERTFIKILDAGPPITRKMLLDDLLLLIGDAGFVTDPVSGGGMGFGLLAAKTAIDSCFCRDPQKEFYEHLGSLIHDLERSYQISRMLYPKTIKEKRRINDRFLTGAKEAVREEGILSLGKIAEEILAKQDRVV